MESTTVLFLHLTRTGGGTLDQVLCRHFQRSAQCNISAAMHDKPGQLRVEDFLALPQATRDRMQLIYGHMPFGLHKTLSVPYRYITLLRNPFDRALSEYYYVKERPKHPYYSTLSPLTLEEYLQSDYIGVSNYYTHMLSLEKKFSTIEPAMLAHDALERAKANLSNFALVGITERFDETLLLLGKLFRWVDLFYTKSGVNRTRLSTTEVPHALAKTFASRNTADIELYTYANELFTKALIPYGDSLEKDLKRFRTWNKRLEQLGITPLRSRATHIKKRLRRTFHVT